MNYLKEYNIKEEEIINIEKVLDAAEVNIDIFLYNEDKVKRILDLFKNIGVKNLYEVIITNPYMFYDTVKYTIGDPNHTRFDEENNRIYEYNGFEIKTHIINNIERIESITITNNEIHS